MNAMARPCCHRFLSAYCITGRLISSATSTICFFGMKHNIFGFLLQNALCPKVAFLAVYLVSQHSLQQVVCHSYVRGWCSTK
ncbi:hypothetical protein LZ31DRAFT_66465 [Colletotrichum somersetense]|nr:hypothetical protein LZ31DRAFT_66465 [Colletotrichum somersetense]